MTVGNFSMSQDVLQFNAGAGTKVNYTSIIPFALTETIVIKNLGGAVVRTLVASAARTAGIFTDAWNGQNDSGALVPDGPYSLQRTSPPT